MRSNKVIFKYDFALNKVFIYRQSTVVNVIDIRLPNPEHTMTVHMFL